jgi:hypothetical protein
VKTDIDKLLARALDPRGGTEADNALGLLRDVLAKTGRDIHRLTLRENTEIDDDFHRLNDLLVGMRTVPTDDVRQEIRRRDLEIAGLKQQLTNYELILRRFDRYAPRGARKGYWALDREMRLIWRIVVVLAERYFKRSMSHEITLDEIATLARSVWGSEWRPHLIRFFNLRGEVSLPAGRRTPPRHYVQLRIIAALLTAGDMSAQDLLDLPCCADDDDREAVRAAIANLTLRT